MARNEEKAQSMLNRWVKLKSGAIDDNAKRPHLASMASTVHEAEKWRGQIVKDISRKVLLIQNRGNPESKTRQLNDEINKLLREKRHWERRIVELGGANHSRAGDPQLLDENGNELPGSRGYRYFGAARDLPGVRDLFSKAPANSADVRRSRGDMNKFVDSAYYGFRDDDDGELVPAEAEAEAAAIAAAQAEWDRVREEKVRGGGGVGGKQDDEEDNGKFVSFVPLPSQADIENAILAKRKAELLQRYASKELLESQAITAAVTGSSKRGRE